MSDTATLPALPVELSIYTAADTGSAWRAWLAANTATIGSDGDATPVDASQVDVVDGAGIQLLISLTRILREHGVSLELTAPSQVLQDACVALGVEFLLHAQEQVAA